MGSEGTGTCWNMPGGIIRGFAGFDIGMLWRPAGASAAREPLGDVNRWGRDRYDEAKRYAEAITMAFHRAYGMKTHIARIFNTFGPRMKLDDGRVVPAFLSQALQEEPITVFGTGEQTRSFCYVSDLVDGLVRLSRSEERMPVNLGNPLEMTMLEFAERIKALTGSSSEIVYHPLPEAIRSGGDRISRRRGGAGVEPRFRWTRGCG